MQQPTSLNTDLVPVSGECITVMQQELPAMHSDVTAQAEVLRPVNKAA